MNYMIYDCEIARCIPTGAKDSRYEYCGGWDDFEGMGISVIGLYYSDTDQYDWMEPSREDLDLSPGINDVEKYFDFRLTIVGFNSRNFDDKLLRANNVHVTTDYDLLEEIRISAGFTADYRSVPKGYSYSLGKLGEANGFPKTGTGTDAPQLWQRGEKKAVIDYCINDVRITKSLLDLGLAGELIDPNTGEKLTLRPLSKGE